MTRWKVAFHRSEQLRDRIIELLAPSIPARDLIATFEPDVEGLAVVVEQYGAINRGLDQRFAAEVYAKSCMRRAETAEDSEQAVLDLMAAHRAWHALEQDELVRTCLERAVQIDPHAYFARYALGAWLTEHELYTEAAEHLSWCEQQRPNDARLAQFSQWVVRKSLDADRQKIRQASAIRSRRP